MNLNKKNFSPYEVGIIITKLSRAEKLGLIRSNPENNEYLLRGFCGTGENISQKWNIKIYKYSEKRSSHSVVCTDMEVLRILLSDNFDFNPPELPIIKIDDSGWGFPLCGVMIGVTDEITLYTAVVPVEFFQGDKFTDKKYLKEYTKCGVELIAKLGATPMTHRIEICSGFINQHLRDELRKLGFHVRIVEITGMLQDSLEEEYRKYAAEELKSDIYYDPKGFKKEELPKKFADVLEFGKKYFPEKLKTGWKSIGEKPDGKHH